MVIIIFGDVYTLLQHDAEIATRTYGDFDHYSDMACRYQILWRFYNIFSPCTPVKRRLKILHGET